MKIAPVVRPWIAPALIIAIGLVAYAGSLEAPFVFDDYPAVVRNETLRHLWPPAQMLRPPADAAGATGRPLVNVSLAFNYAWGALDVRGYHATNLVLHGLAALLLWSVTRRTLQAPAIPERLRALAAPIAFWTAAVWGLHPLLTESVICVAQRNEILGSIFYLLALWGLLRAAEASAIGGGLWPAVPAAATVLGALCKETIVTAPILLLVYDRTFLAGSFRAAWRKRWALHLGTAASWAVIAALMLRNHDRSGTVGFGLGVTSWEYLLTQCRALLIYLKLAIWPAPLVLDYGTAVVHTLGEVWPQAVVIGALLAATAWALVRRPPLGFIGAAFFLLLAPSSSFVPLTTQTIAEHRMYLPLAPVLVAAVVALATRMPRWPVAVSALVLLESVLVAYRSADYRSELSIWRDTVAKVPGSPRAHASLATAFGRAGRWAEAVPHYEAALRLDPNYADAQSDLATALVHAGQPDAATPHYERAAALKPADADIRYNLGLHYTTVGREVDATTEFTAALRLRPDFPAARLALGRELNQQGRYAEAAAVLEPALREAGPTAGPAWSELGFARVNLQDWSAAETAYRHALAVLPPASRGPTLFLLGNLLLETRRAAEAIAVYRDLLQAQPKSALVHHHLALALALSGQRDEAIAAEREALALDPQLADARANLERWSDR